MVYILLILTTITATGKALACKKIGTTDSSLRIVMRQNSIIFITALFPVVLMLLPDLSVIFTLSPFSFILSMVFAASMILTQTTEIKAMSLGSSSMTILIYSCGFLLPIFFGYFRYDEAVSLWQVFGIFILLGALYLMISPEKNFKISFKWLFFSLLSMIGSGLNAIIQKIHQYSQFSDELLPFLISMFFFCALFSFVVSIFAPKTSSVNLSFKERIIVPVVSGLFIGVLNILNLTLAGKLPSIIHFPIYSIGSMILTGVLGTLIFKEKNTKKQLIGFGIGCIAITIIGIL